MKNIYKILLTVAALLTISVALAQPNPPATPIDGGLSLLLAAGGLYGVKKIRDYNRSVK